IPAPVVLKQFDRSPNHIGQAGLFVMRLKVIRISELAASEDPKKFWPSPARNGFKLGFRPRNIESFPANFRKQIAPVFARAILCLRKKILGAASEGKIDGRDINE